MNQAELMRRIGIWARQHGKPKPTTRHGMELLIAEFFAWHSEQPGWQEVAGDAPVHVGVNGAGVHILNEADPEGSDWDQMMVERSEAMSSGDGDDLARDAILAQQDKSAAAAIAPPVNSNPSSLIGAIIGGQAQPNVPSVATNTEALAQAIQLCSWVGENNETTNVIINISSIIPIPAVGLASSFRSRAIVQFGTRGYLSTVYLDIGQGAQFVVGASNVIVQAKAWYRTGSISASRPPTFTGMLSIGDISRTEQLTYTDYTDTVTVGGFTSTVPPYAKTVTPLFDINATGAATVQLAFTTADGSNVYFLTIDPTKQQTPIVIPADVTNIICTPNAGTASGYLVYGLGL